MPKILSRQPRWLDHDTPAFEFFQPSDGNLPRRNNDYNGPLRRVAHRGSEIFAAVGTEIRWSDLPSLKEAGEGDATRSGRERSLQQHSYRTLKTPASRPIQQLSISPSGEYIAVLTTHTCHVCLLPPHEHLRFHDTQPVKLRSYQVGPTAHVLEQAPIVSAIWHPLSPSRNDLVTVTKDACVRLWEVDQNNRSTFNEPALAVDLKKLANASSQREDLTASKYGTNTGFSPDDAEMEVAASCFGGEGQDDEDGWSSMTLWVAMSEGDVYALCPFLPSKFWAPATLLPSLSTSVMAKQTMDRQASEFERLVAQQQRSWLAELDQQEPTSIPGLYDMEVYSRPENQSAIPRLQGPFQLSPEPDFGEITDIHVVAPKLNEEAYFDDQDDFADLAEGDGLSVGIVCLATNTSKVHVCLNVEGVEASWLPPKRSRVHYLDDLDAIKDLVLLETADLARHEQSTSAWPTFTTAPNDRYEIFTSQPGGIFNLSFRPWISGLEDELSAPSNDGEGVEFRLNVLMEAASTNITAVTSPDHSLRNVSAAVAVLDQVDTDLGYVVLALAQNQPHAAILDVPVTAVHMYAPDVQSAAGAFAAHVSRAPYQPDPVFGRQTALPNQINEFRRTSGRGVSDQVRFSPDTLQKITKAHQILSSETHALGLAAGDLFRKCQSMVDEMKHQIEKVKELSNRVNSVTGEDEFPDQSTAGPELVRGGKQKIEKRIDQQREKTVELRERVENLCKKMRNVGGKEMSAKERAFAEEVARLEQTIIPATEAPTSPGALLKMDNSDLTLRTESDDSELVEQETIVSRFKAVETVYKQLVAQAAEAQRELEARQAQQNESRPASAPSHARRYRQQKITEVFSLLDQEAVLLDAVGERLERLQMASR